MSSPSWPSVPIAMANSPTSVLSTSSQSTSESESQFSFGIQQRFSPQFNSSQRKQRVDTLQAAAEIERRRKNVFEEEDDDGDGYEENLSLENNQQQQQAEDEEDEGNFSAFTDPSWYGSPFARRDSQLAWPYSPLGVQESKEYKTNTLSHVVVDDDTHQKLESYQKGLNLARRALFDLDSELDKKYGKEVKEDLLEQRFKKSTKALGKRRAIDDRSNPPVPASCGTEILVSFEQSPSFLCASCGTTLALQDELISKAFSGRDGKAYLFFSILNIRSGPKEDRQLLTGLHTVADLSCATCQRSVGWSYLRAFEASQRYKEGKFILERASLHKTNNWSALGLDGEDIEMIF